MIRSIADPRPADAAARERVGLLGPRIGCREDTLTAVRARCKSRVRFPARTCRTLGGGRRPGAASTSRGGAHGPSRGRRVAWQRLSWFRHAGGFLSILRKEVIQPQVPLRLPCYDLVPITGFIFGACLAAPTTSDAPRFGGLTGGVYKAQEHIHRGNADPRLLAIPASCGRVAARNPN